MHAGQADHGRQMFHDFMGKKCFSDSKPGSSSLGKMRVVLDNIKDKVVKEKHNWLGRLIIMFPQSRFVTCQNLAIARLLMLPCSGWRCRSVRATFPALVWSDIQMRVDVVCNSLS
jgi:hypothetical protein